MEILGIFAGATALAALVQSKPLPSEAEALKALEKLEKDPNDPEANLIAGKYKAFVLGDWKEGMEFLIKSSDKTLKPLAEHELDPRYTPTAPQKVTMGNEWVLAVKKFPALYRIFFDRAGKWYAEAYPELEPLWKDKLKEQGQKLSAAKPPGITKKTLPSKWGIGAGTPILDGTVSHTGSYSVKLLPGDPKVPGSLSFFQSDPIPLTVEEVEFSAYVRSEDTEGKTDEIFLSAFDKDGGYLGASGVKIAPDLPFWHRISHKIKLTPNAFSVRIGATIRSKKGAAWVDDMSVKMDGKEVLKNLSFEER